MHTELRFFLNHLTGVVIFTLVPVVLTAFVSMPLSMNRHPGDLLPHQAVPSQHMT